MTRILFLTLLLIIIAVQGAFAGTGTITKDMVTDKYAQLENALNNHDDAMETIQILHNYISDDALFRLSVTNPAVSKSEKSPILEMNKQDYINTYIQGAHTVSGYNMNIETQRFEYDQKTRQAYTLDVMTERGIMMSNLNDGKPFISKTICRTQHEMQQGKLVATAGECHTDISFEEDI